MSNDVYLEGKKYISLKSASLLFGYASDYVGQLCRGKKLEAKMIGRSWYVDEASIENYLKNQKPEKRSVEIQNPNRTTRIKSILSTRDEKNDVFENGKKYVSLKKASSAFGYASDYIGQLCREGKLEGKIISRSWYVCESALAKYKADQERNVKVEEVKYVKDVRPLIPALVKVIPVELIKVDKNIEIPVQAPILSPFVKDLAEKTLALAISTSLVISLFTANDINYGGKIHDQLVRGTTTMVKDLQEGAHALASINSMDDLVAMVGKNLPANVFTSLFGTVKTYVASLFVPKETPTVDAPAIAINTPTVSVPAYEPKVVVQERATTKTFTERFIVGDITRVEVDQKFATLNNQLQAQLALINVNSDRSRGSFEKFVSHPAPTYFNTSSFDNPTVSNLNGTFGTLNGSTTTVHYLLADIATTTNFYAQHATFGDTNLLSLIVGALNGPLQANNGVLSATTSVGVLYGGTGLTTAPSYGQVLVGNTLGGYTLGATSTLGFITSDVLEGTNLYYTDARVNAFTHGSSTIPKTYTTNSFTALNTFTSGITSQASSTLAYLSSTYATSTNATSTNLFATNANFTNSTSTFSFATTASSTNLYSQIANLGTLSVLALTSGLATFSQGFISQASSTVNYLSTVFSTSTNATSTNLFATNANFTNSTSTFSFATTASSTNLYSQIANLGTLSVLALTSGLATFSQGFISQASSTVNYLSTVFSTSTNATSTNLFATNANFTNSTSTFSFATTASSTNLYSQIANLGTLSVLALTSGLATFSQGFISQASSTVNYLSSTYATSTNATSTNLFATNANFTNSTSTFSFATTASSTNLYSQIANLGTLSVLGLTTFTGGNVGIGTTSPSSLFAVNGNAYTSGTSFFGGAITATSTFTVAGITNSGILTNTSNGTSTFSGGLSAAGLLSNNFIEAQSFKITSTTATSTFAGNLTLGTNSSNYLTVNSSISSNLIPDGNNTRNLGSPSNYWNNGYVDTLSVNTLSAGNTSINGTISSSFVINSDNVSADGEDSSLIFHRGSLTNAVILWDHTLDQFNFNNALTVTGNLGVGTTSLASLFSVQGNSYISGTSFFGGAITGTSSLMITGGTSTIAYLSSTYATSTNATSTNLFATNANFTNSTSTFSFATTASSTNLYSQIANLGTLSVLGLTTFTGGNVGIGTTSPSSLFAVNGNAYTSGTSFFGGAITGTSSLMITGGTSTIAYLSSTYATSTNATSTNLFATNANFTNSTSTFSFATTASSTNLFSQNATFGTLVNSLINGVNATFSGTLSVTGLTTLGYASTTQISSTGSAYFATTGGNVGIGTTSPGVALDVIGSSSGSLRLSDASADATNKLGRIIGRPFTNIDTNFLAFDIRGLTASNEINYGGGSGILNAATLHRFYTAATKTTLTGTEQLRIDNNGVYMAFNGGNVGIGTTSPYALLSVSGGAVNNGTTSNAPIAVIANTNTGTGVSYVGLDFANNEITTGAQYRRAQIFAGYGGTSNISGFLAMSTANTSGALSERLRINENGNVGIGTTSPNYKLTVAGGVTILDVADTRFTSNSNSITTGIAGLTSQLTDSTGTTQGRFHLAVSAGPGTAHLSTASQYDVYLTTSGAGTTYGNILFATGNSEKMRIASSTGYVGIGTTAPGYKLEVNGQVAVNSDLVLMASGVAKGYIFGSGDNLYIRALDTKDIVFQESGSTMVTMKGDTGNVGIGTTSPAVKLSIAGTNDVTSGIAFSNSAGPNMWNLLPAIGGVANTGFSFEDATSGTRLTRMVINSTGYVGIGATVPTAKLQIGSIDNGSTPDLQFTYDGASYRNGIYNVFDSSSAAANKMKLFVSDSSTTGKTTVMTLTGTGNVGIGTTTPGQRLSVVSSFLSGNADGLLIDNTGSGSSKYSALLFGRYGGGSNGFMGMWGDSRSDRDDVYIGGGSGQRIAATNIAFYTTGTLGTVVGSEIMRITGGGNVGIGTTTPNSKLNIWTGAAGSATVADVSADDLVIESNAGAGITILGTNAGGQALVFGIPGDAVASRLVYDGLNNQFTIGTANASDFIQFQVADQSNAMRITTDGNVGIGTTTPNQKLSIFNSGADAAIEFSTITGANEKWTIGVDDSDASRFKIASSSALGTSDRLVIDGGGYLNMIGSGGIGKNPGLRLHSDSTYDITRMAEIYADTSLNGGLNYVDLVFATDSNSTITERMRITDDGNVGIGTTAPLGKLSIMKSAMSTGYTTAEGYLHIGATNELLNGTALINFGFTDGTTYTYAPAYMGWLETTYAGGEKGDLIFGTRDVTSNTQASERLRITSAGNIGIGTTSPSQVLSVAGKGYFSTGLIATLPAIGANTGQLVLMKDDSNLTTDATQLTWDSANDVMSVNGLQLNTTSVRSSNSDNLQLGSANTFPSITVLGSTGNVGIGDASPTNKLDVAGAIGISDTTVIDASRNLVNIGTITSGAINSQTISSTASFTGTVNAVTGYKVNGAATSGNVLRGDGTNFISATIGGGDITGAALTKADDTNVTLTLGGTPTTALLRAASMTLGWTGQLSVGRGGTGASTLGASQLVYGNGTGAVATVATSTLAVGTGLTSSGTLGYQVGGTNSSISFAAIAANSLWANQTGASAVPTAIATSSLFTWTGTGDVVRATSPTLVTPNIGAASGSSLNLGGGTITSGAINGQTISSAANFTGTLSAVSTITGTTLNGTTGLNTGASAGTQRIDASGNLVNIGTITSGAINSQTISSTASFTGTVNAVTGYKVNGAATSGNVLRGDGTNFISATIGGGDITGAALTKADDTNVTLTLGGTPTTALLRAASMTLGWTGQLSVGRGGTGASTLGASQLVYGNGTGAVATVATSTLAVGTGLTSSGTLGYQVGGTNSSISFAAIAANSLWANQTGASAVPTAIATSSLFTWTGTGDVVRATSPTLVTPNIGAASGSSLNLGGGTITSGAINGQTISSAANFTGTLSAVSTITGTTLNGTTGLNTGASAGTQRIDASGNLVNIGTITSGAINSQTISSTASFTGTVNAVTGYKVNGAATSGNVLRGDGTNFISATIGGGDITGAALTKADDTNVTLTLGGTPTTALLRAASMTLGWTGQLSVGRGGTGASTLGASQLVYGNGTGAVATVATSTLAVGTGLTSSGTLGYQVGGTNSSISFAAIAANSLWANQTGASAVPTAIATSSLFTWTGTGDVVRATSPTLVTPNIGAASGSSLNLGGGTITSGAINGQTISSAANFTGTLSAVSTITGTTLNGTTGLNTGASAGTQRIDASGNLVNIGTITSGAINSQTISSTASFTGTVNAVTGYKVNGAATSGNVLRGDGTNFISATIGGGDITGAALTKADDTNVTLTLGGTPTTALLRAASMTLGWTGQLSVGRGGTGASTLGASQLVYGNGTGAVATVATSTLAVGTGLTSSGTLGYQVGGTNSSISFAAIAANSLWANQTGASAVPTAIATSSLFTWTGTGDVVRATSPTLVTPNIGAASGSSLNLGGGTITSGAINGQTISSAANFTGTLSAVSTITGTTLNGTTGLNTGASAGTQRIDASGNLVNIGTITSGAINSQTISSTASFTGTVNAVTGYKVNGAATSGNVLRGDGTNFISATIGGGDITGAALTKADDTNVTLTLGGTPTTALLRAASMTLGWTGQLSVGRGGTGASTLGASQLVYGNGTGAVATVATSTLAVGTGLTSSGTLGYQVGGTNSSISFAAIAANSLWANQTGASAVPTAIATSSLFTWTGTGDVVRATSPTLVTPNIGAASGSSLNLGGGTITSGAINGQTISSAANFTGTLSAVSTITGTTLNGTTGLNTGASAGTQRIDASGNLVNIGTITSGAINSQTISSTASFTGTVNAVTGYKVNGAATSGNVLRGDGTNFISATIGGGDITGAALTKADDTNVTLTLGGTPTTALLRAASMTLGWTGQLSVGRGGTGASTLGASQLVYGNGTGAVATVATSTLAVGTGLTSSGTLGYQVGGTNSSISFAAIAANSLWANQTGASAVPTAIATSSLFTWTGTGDVVRATSPTLVTPNIGAASGSSLNLGGGTITSGAINGQTISSAANFTGTLSAVSTITGTTLNGTTGLNTGASAGTQRIDASGNLVNIGTITSGAINSQTISSTASFTGTVNAVTGYKVNGAATSGNVLRGDGTNFISATIGGGDITGAALTKADDTNVTLTLGGTPTTALLRAASMTLGWTGQLSVGRGGTGASTLTGLLQGNGTGAITGITGTAGQFPYYNGASTLLATSSLFLSTAGNVGIGTVSPGSALSVKGAVASGTKIFGVGNTTDAYEYITVNSSGTSGNSYALNTSGVLNVGSNGSDKLYSITGNGGALFGINAGNVGIGTTTPIAKLGISSGNTVHGVQLLSGSASSYTAYAIGRTSDDGVLGVAGGGNDWAVGTSAGDLILTTKGVGGKLHLASRDSSNAPELTVTSGNVGIGTTSPAGLLAVHGSSRGFYVESTGNVGIGIADAKNPLDVRGEYVNFNNMTDPIVHIVSTTAAAVDVGGTLQFSGMTGNSTPLFGFAGIKGAKASASGSNYTGYLNFYTTDSGGTFYERVRITALDELVLGRADGTATPAAMTLRGTANAGSNIVGKDITFEPSNGTGTGGSGALIFKTAPVGASGFTVNTLTERLRITAGGNLGIGTTSPAQTLAVSGSGYFTTSVGIGTNDTSSMLVIKNGSNRSIDNYSPLSSDGNGANLVWSTNTTGSKADVAYFGAVQDGATQQSGRFYWQVGNSGAPGIVMTLNKAGNLGLGSGVVVPASKLGVVGNVSVGATYATVAAPTSGMIIEGNVGIGTTGPLNKLHVVQNIAETSAMSINSTAVAKLSNTNNTAANLTLLKFSGPENDTSVLLGSRLVNASNGDSAFVIGARNGSGVLTEQFTMLSSGNVGIGTTSPSNVLAVSGNTTLYTSSGVNLTLDKPTGSYLAFSRAGVIAGSINGSNGVDGLTFNYGAAQTVAMTIGSTGNVGIGTTTPGSLFAIEKYLNTTDGPTLYISNSNDSISTNSGFGSILFGSKDLSSGSPAAPAKIRAWTNDAGNGALLSLYTSPNSGAPTEQIRIDKDGYTGLRNLTTATSNTLCYNTSTLSGFYTFSSCSSSMRYKKNISNLTLGFDEFKQLRPVVFDWKSNDEHDLGFVAEETEAISPLLVTYYNGQVEGVKYSQMTSLLTKILQQVVNVVDVKNATTTTPSIYIDATGNIGIGLGTTTPAYKLQVLGDVAAQSFVNISTRDSKKNITYKGDSDKSSIYEKIKNIKIADYRYLNESSSAPLHLGLIAEEAPTEVLSVDGKGVDVYKLASFTILGVQEIQKRLDALDVRVTKLELMASMFGTTTPVMAIATSTTASSTIAVVLDYMKTLGTDITASVANFTRVITGSLTVGTPAKPTGITLYDDATGAPYCVRVSNTVLRTTPGDCLISSTVVVPAVSPTPSSVTTPSPAQIPVVVTEAIATPVSIATSTPVAIETPIATSTPSISSEPTTQIFGSLEPSPTPEVGTPTPTSVDVGAEPTVTPATPETTTTIPDSTPIVSTSQVSVN